LKTLKRLHRLSKLGMSTLDKQRRISTNDVFYLWTQLVQRYFVTHLTEIFASIARDEDLKLILVYGKRVLVKNIELLEKKMIENGIPLPTRPPKNTELTERLEIVTDRHIFRRVLRRIQSFLPTHTMALTHSISPENRDIFMTFLDKEMKLYDKFLEYGKLKGYLLEPPVYKLHE
jgi:hypothetical protein